MNYALAKELKDAGFPESDAGRTRHHPECDIDRPQKDCLGYGYQPTLSELIEACGEQFERLERDTESTEPNGVYWTAYAHSQDHGEFGSTPEEAVVRLWLALKKSKAEQP
jgi:hypothetical protein